MSKPEQTHEDHTQHSKGNHLRIVSSMRQAALSDRLSYQVQLEFCFRCHVTSPENLRVRPVVAS